MREIVKNRYMTLYMISFFVFSCNLVTQKKSIDTISVEKKCSLDEYAFIYFIVDPNSDFRMTRAEFSIYDGEEFLTKNIVMRNKRLVKLSRKITNLKISVYGMDDNSFKSMRDFITYNEKEENPRYIIVPPNWKEAPGQLSFITFRGSDVSRDLQEDYILKIMKNFGFNRYEILTSFDNDYIYINNRVEKIFFSAMMNNKDNRKFLRLINDQSDISRNDTLYLFKNNTVYAEVKVIEIKKTDIYFEILCGETEFINDELLVIKK